MEQEIKLGNKVKDKITGFEGIATGRAEYLHAATSILVEAPVKDGKALTSWTEATRLVVVEG